MKIRPTQLSPDEQTRFDAHMRDLFDRLLDEVRVLLADIEAPELQQLVYDLAFAPGDVLPKRLSRPQLAIAHLTEQVYLAVAASPDDQARRRLLRFAIVVQEYYDMLDDVVDGDVAAGHEPRVMVVTQLLMPLMVRLLGQFGPQAIDYWTSRALRMVESLYLEKCKPKSFEAYMASIAQQSYFFGFATGLAAVVAGRDEASVARAEGVGRLGYQYAQFILDLYQKGRDSEDNWNATHFMDDDTIVDHLREWKGELDAHLSHYPDAQRFLIGALFSVELDSWLD